ncbi:MAG: hypothetical protein ACI9OJ_001742 [Myxococcota bacterium]|jgi:hypothetical protein
MSRCRARSQSPPMICADGDHWVTWAVGLPQTLWGSHALGLKFDMGPVFLIPEAGLFWYDNVADSTWGPWFGGTLGIHFGGPDSEL